MTRERFDRIWDKARRWLTNEEFNLWLCFCYGAMSNTDDKETLASSIDGKIYVFISERKRYKSL